MSLVLHTIICSTRPGRIGPALARWFNDFAVQHGKFQASLVDLVDFELPIYDEPNHPALQKYVKEHTKRWSESVAAADAYAFVTPEYNYGPPPSFVNALNFVYKEFRQLWGCLRRVARCAAGEAARHDLEDDADDGGGGSANGYAIARSRQKIHAKRPDQGRGDHDAA